MRSSKNGVIINIIPIAGEIATPFRSVYSGGKAALEIISETLAMEVRNFGIDVVQLPLEILRQTFQKKISFPYN